MDRVEQSKEKYNQLFGDGVPDAYATDPDFQDILSRFIFGDVFHQGNLCDKQRELITLVVLTTNQTLFQLKAHVQAALNVGLTPVEIKEAVYQCAPYIGFPKTLNAINEVNDVFTSNNITLPLESQKQVQEDSRFDKGLAVQIEIFGSVIAKMRESTPANQKHIQDYLSSFCFGDFYTRGGIDLRTRELLTLCIISALGGSEGQVKAHVQGNKNVGHDKETLIAALTHCLPYIGFPRILNALACVNEIIPENEERVEFLMSTIQDKVVIITGASSGIGEATAKELASKGAKLVLAARREDRLKIIQAEIQAKGGQAIYKVVDVTSHDQVQQLAAFALKAFGQIDVLVNNAGIMPQAFLSKNKVDEWDKMIDVNIKGVLYAIAAVTPSMRERKSGHIINLSSVAGHNIYPGGTVYCGTKYAVRAISEGLRQEEAMSGTNIRVTNVSPGAVSSELLATTTDPEVKAGLNDFYKIAIDADRIARAIAFAIEQPSDVAINEMIIRPTAQVS